MASAIVCTGTQKSRMELHDVPATSREVKQQQQRVTRLVHIV